MDKRVFVLQNGFRVTVVPNRAIPIVEAQGWVESGSLKDRRRWLGLLVSKMLTRGTARHSRDEFEDLLDEWALKYSAGESDISKLFIEWSGTALPAHFHELCALVAESICSPIFPEEELKIVKAQEQAKIAANASNPAVMAQKELQRMLFGPAHPYFAMSPEESLRELKSFERDDLADFWRKQYRPNCAGVVVVGDIDARDAERCVNGSFGSWKKKEKSEDTPFDASDFAPDGYEERVVYVPEKASAVSKIGHRTDFSFGHPDFPAMQVAVSSLGGGMHSRLSRHVREKHGLSYSARASLVGSHTPGFVSLTAHTNPENILRAQEETRRVFSELCENGITEEELGWEKAVWFGHRAIEESSFSGISQGMVREAISGVPNVLLDQQIRDLSVTEVNDAIYRHLKPDNVKVVRSGSVS